MELSKFSGREVRSDRNNGLADVLDKNRPRFGKRSAKVYKMFI